jgi:hypothetical protein
VVRIDPEERALDGEPVAVAGAVPLDLATSAGSVWVTDAGDLRREGAARRGGVARIDAARQRLAGPPLRTGRAPVGGGDRRGRGLGRGHRRGHGSRRS